MSRLRRPMTGHWHAVLLAVACLGLTVAPPRRAAGYEEIAVTGGGALAGTVTFAGRASRLSPVPVREAPDVCGAREASEALVLGPNAGVRGAVVLIDGVARGKKVAGEIVLDSARCAFTPHVSVTTVGGRALVRNSDAFLHNPQGFLGKTRVFDLALPKRDQVIDITRRLSRTGAVRVVCGAHPHMSAWLVVHDSPYVAVTDERGRFRIEHVPPGTYRVRMWHEGFRRKGSDRDGRPLYREPTTVRRTVTVGPAGTVTVDFVLR